MKGGLRGLTEDNERLLVRVGLILLDGMAVIVDGVEGVADKTGSGEIGQSPGPSQGRAQLPAFGLGSLVGVGSSEGDATGIAQLEGDSRSGRCSRSSRESPGEFDEAMGWGELVCPRQRGDGTRGGHCEGRISMSGEPNGQGKLSTSSEYEAGEEEDGEAVWNGLAEVEMEEGEGKDPDQWIDMKGKKIWTLRRRRGKKSAPNQARGARGGVRASMDKRRELGQTGLSLVND